MHRKFSKSDPWIYLSIAYNRKEAGASLADVIAAADYINHAIPTREELEGAVNRFLRYGLIRIQNDMFYLTGLIRDDYEALSKRTGYCLDQWDKLDELLAKKTFEPIGHEPYVLDNIVFKKACRTYCGKN